MLPTEALESPGAPPGRERLIVKGAIEGLLRILATAIGLVGALIAFFVDLLHTLITDTQKGGLGFGHFFLGLLVTILAFVGALVSFPFPLIAAVLMVLGSIGLFLIAGGAAFFAIPFLLIAAVLAFLDRNKGKAATNQG
jgi:hypothetical protein